jgi:MauM/NapG family ferredoxin protein
VGAASAGALRLTGTTLARPLRPPGAVDEATFTGVCVRCGNCARACPTDIIKADLGGHGLRSLLTPILEFRDGYCREDCVACTKVCPSGALARMDADEKGKSPLGVPAVDMSICLLGDERECTECKRWCPHEAIRYVFSEAEYTLVPVIDAAKCTGCGACEMACPVTPKKAIVVAPLPA